MRQRGKALLHRPITVGLGLLIAILTAVQLVSAQTSVYPTGLDNLCNPTPSEQTIDVNCVHSKLHAAENAGIQSLEQKVGTNASTPQAGMVLGSTSLGASTWLTPVPTATVVPTATIFPTVAAGVLLEGTGSQGVQAGVAGLAAATPAAGTFPYCTAGGSGCLMTFVSPARTLITDTKLGGSALSITFSSIPATYKDLILLLSVRTDRAAVADYIRFQFNSDNAGNYAEQQMGATGAVALLGSNSAITGGYIFETSSASTTAGITAGGDMRVFDYASTTLKKATKSSGGFADTTAANSRTDTFQSTWNSTAAVNQIVIFPDIAGTNFVAGSRVTLYGEN